MEYYSIIYFLLAVLFDSFFFGFCYEIKLKGLYLNRGIFNSRIFDTIYNGISGFVEFLFSKMIIYRIVQKIFEIMGLIIIWQLTGSYIPVIGLILSHYFMSYDLGYYFLMNQFEIAEISNKHLNRWYIFGGWIFLLNGHFDRKQFIISGIIGLLFILATSLNFLY